MARHLWSDAEVEILKAKYPDTKTETIADQLGLSLSKIYAKAKKLGLEKTSAYRASLDAGRLRPGSRVGAKNWFPKGHVPHNKGKKGACHPGSVATQFKPGQKAKNWLPIGSERITSDGYLQRKMTDTGYPPRDWVGVHILLWLEHHGPIPEGYILAFKDRDQRNVTIENLELITRRERMERNSIHRYPPELKDTIRLAAKLRRKINEQSGHN